MKHFLFLLLLSFSVTAAFAQSRDNDGDGVPNSEDVCSYIAGHASNKGCPLSDKSVARPVPAAVRPETVTTTATTPATAPKPTAAEKRAAREEATRKLTDYIFSGLLDAASRGALEEYKGSSAEPLPAAGGGTKPTWASRTQIPDAEETMCFYKDNGTFNITGIYKSEPAAEAARREETLAALLKSIAERKGGKVSADSEGRTVYLLGKGGMYLNRSATGNAGEEYVTVNAQGLD